MNNETTVRTTAIMLAGDPYQTPTQSTAFVTALHDDLHELLGAAKLRLPTASTPENAKAISEAISSAEGNILLTWCDTAALPIHAVAGALDALKSMTAVVGACASGDLYLLGLEGPIEPELADEFAKVLTEPNPLEGITDLLDELETETAVLPPWFRVKNAEQLAFAENLARLSLLSEDGEDDFIADRLRVWFEENADE
ncbi:hypothetical protein OAU50_05230 [Planctomycetota bacterium]|nr:hypothetical protein [Planctomycetota bacterium]